MRLLPPNCPNHWHPGWDPALGALLTPRRSSVTTLKAETVCRWAVSAALSAFFDPAEMVGVTVNDSIDHNSSSVRLDVPTVAL